MPMLHQMIEGKYLRKEDVTSDTVVTIAKIGEVNVAQEDSPTKDMKWAARFQEFGKPMVLNNTNLQILAQVCGSNNSDDWIGHRVVVYVDQNVSYQGKLIGGLRIRAFVEPPPQQQPMGTREYRDPAAQAQAVATRVQNMGGANKLLNDLDDDIPFANPYRGRLCYVV